MTKSNEPVALFWFRRDLRLDDNVGLTHALNSGYSVLPVFIFDKNILGKLEEKHDRRLSFIHGALEAMQQKITAAGSSLRVMHGTPEQAMQQLLAEYDVRAVYTNSDYEPYALERDRQIRLMLEKSGVPFHSFKDQVIFEKNEVVKSDGTPYTVFTPYSKVWKRKLTQEDLTVSPSEQLLGNFLKTQPLPLPSLEDTGFAGTDMMFKPPEINTGLIANYHRTRNIPSIEGTTRLGIHLRFGTVSIRKLVAAAIPLSEVWLNELIWREFFMSILWHFPHVVDNSFRKKYDNISWRNNEEEFERWCNGMTGYPIVDAGMRELNATGFMHNRVRMITASFLTKHLLTDWRWGEAYFAARLLDYELSSNNGNWQWAAGSGCDAAPYFRVFNPTEQTRKFDPGLAYVRRWVPEHETPEYPRMIVDHALARERALKTYKEGIG
jgi:deoxyribodipyrimidine photo-lyase